MDNSKAGLFIQINSISISKDGAELNMFFKDLPPLVKDINDGRKK